MPYVFKPLENYDDKIEIVYKAMTKEECFNDIKELWEKYVDVEYHYYTTHDKRQVEDLLDNIERLIKE